MLRNVRSEGEGRKRREEGKISMNGLMPAAAFSESVRCSWVTLALLKEGVTQYSKKKETLFLCPLSIFLSFSLSLSH